MKKNIFAITVFISMIALVFAICVNTQAKARMSMKNLTIEVSKTHTLKLKGVKGKIIWKSSKPGVAKVNKKGKVTALRKGKTTITARAGRKLYKCMIIVKDKKGTDKSTAKSEQPTATSYGSTSTPDLSTPKPSEPTLQPTLEPISEPTPVPTPDNLDSEYCYPCVMDYDAYMNCRISDIGEDFFEISDLNGEVICSFSKYNPELEINKYYYNQSELESGTDLLGVIYDGTITKWGTETSLKSYEIEGDRINISDIRIGDIVDVVYGFFLDVPVNDRTNVCCGINVHNRSDSDMEYCGPCVQEYAAYMDCRISDIGEDFIEISDADGGFICRFIKYDHYPQPETDKYFFIPYDPESGSGTLEVVYDGKLTEGDTGTPLNSYDKFYSYAVKGDKINYSDIRLGDVVDVVYEYTLSASPNNRKYGCCGINVHKR